MEEEGEDSHIIACIIMLIIIILLCFLFRNQIAYLFELVFEYVKL